MDIALRPSLHLTTPYTLSVYSDAPQDSAGQLAGPYFWAFCHLLLGHPRKLCSDSLHGPLPGLVPAPPAQAHQLALVLSPPVGSRLGQAGGPGWRDSVAVHSFCSIGVVLLDLISVFLILPFCKVYITKFLVFFIYIYKYIYIQTVLFLPLYVQARRENKSF